MKRTIDVGERTVKLVSSPLYKDVVHNATIINKEWQQENGLGI